jgi:hypothetical protein
MPHPVRATVTHPARLERWRGAHRAKVQALTRTRHGVFAKECAARASPMQNAPTSIAYHVKDTTAGDNGDKRGVWTKVGAAWPKKDGKGFNVVLDVVPLDGRFMLREALEQDDAPTI